MPALKRKAPSPTHWPLNLRAAAGSSVDDFFAFGVSSDYDEQHEHLNPPTYHSPTSRYTQVLHYQNRQKQVITQLTDRQSSLWWSPQGHAYGVGFTRALFQLDASGCQEVAIQGIPGTFSDVWGVNEDHLFVCSMYRAHLLYRRFGQWQVLALPEAVPDDLTGLAGLNERDVYCVGGQGAVLHFDGQQVRLLEVPTTRTLICAAALDAQHLCIGGNSGTLLFGNQHGWRLIPTGTLEPIFSLAQYRGTVCFATPSGVYSFDGKQPPSLLLSQVARTVYSVGAGLVLVLDAAAWLFDGQKLFPLDTLL